MLERANGAGAKDLYWKNDWVLKTSHDVNMPVEVHGIVVPNEFVGWGPWRQRVDRQGEDGLAPLYMWKLT
jgi:hypothetical protein